MDKSYVIKPILDETYPLISHGNGVYVYDSSGNQYLDGCSGAVTANIGHGLDEIIDQIAEQGKKIAFVYRSQFANEPAELLAKKLIDEVGNDYSGVFFVNSGSEATETAVKIALQYWQELGKPSKTKLISRWISYHGITNGALALSGHPIRRKKFLPQLVEVDFIEPPYCYRCPFQLTYPNCMLKCATQLETAIKRIGSENIAAFIAEPIIGAAGGAITPPDEYYEIIAKICEENEILFIADEVMTGCGRTGSMLAITNWRVQPHIITLGKGLSAGYSPLAAVILHKQIMEAIESGSKLIMSGHTFSGNPLSTAAGLAVMNYLKKNNVIAKVKEKGEFLQAEIQNLQEKYSFIGEVRGKGLLIGIEFVENQLVKTPFSRQLTVTEQIIKLARRNGLLVYPAQAGLDGINGDAILIAPPLTITHEEMLDLVGRLNNTFHDFSQKNMERDVTIHPK
ncbi:aspartate aminotransferase family protein [Bacillus kwashiorkori]|uniref:aspartate aminotransferase family protein n=1 Tax=Bacillus kwashiorkori TaxID=1522318 RepID=UPI000785C629|nr:aspartate aminotransferase family protein [Bacillus kwashiorkori]